MAKVIVTAPNKGFTGTRHGLEFINGIAEIEEHLFSNVALDRFRREQYKVELPKKAKVK